MIIVTGANGFIGSAMVWEFNQRGLTQITCVDTVTPEERPGPLSKKSYDRFIHTDQLFSELKDDVFAKEISCIVHMGACSDTSEKDVEFLKRNNTEYTKTLFKFCAEKDVPFIYASSGAVYGDGNLGFSDLTDPNQFTPLNPYGDSKLNFDKWVVTQTKMPNKWYGLRFFNVYGPNEYHKGFMSSVVYKAFNQIKETGELKLFKSHNPKYEDGMQMRDFVYVKDITRWMFELYDNSSAKSGIYNLGYGQARTWLDLAECTFSGMETPMKINWIDIPESIRDQYQYFTEASIDKLKGQGLSSPQWPIEKGVEDYVKNYLLQNDSVL